MSKKVVTEVVAELKKLLEAKKIIFGAGVAVKLLRQGKIKKVFISSNCEPSAKAEIEHLCKIGEIEFVELGQSNDEIGVICRKPFAISVVGVTA